MASNFKPISIVSLDVGRTEQSKTASGLRLMHLKLSQSPSNEWEILFNNQRQFPRHSMWRGASISGNFIVVDCVPEEIERLLGDLKEDVSVVNGKYQEYLAKKAAEEQRIAAEQQAEKLRLDQINARLKFD